MSLYQIGFTSYTIAVCLAVSCFWLISMQEPRREQKRIMVMAAVTVIQTLGYWLSFQAGNKEAAILAHKLIMCGGAFIFYSMLLVICSICEIKILNGVRAILLSISALFCIAFANFDHTQLVYTRVSFAVEQDIPRLDLSSGIIYLLFSAMIFSYIIVLVILSVRSYRRATTSRKKVIAFLLLIFEIVPTIAFILDKTAGIGFSLIPFGYMISEFIIIFLIYFLKIYDVKNVAMMIAFSNSQEGIIITDFRNRYQDANSKAMQLFPELVPLSNNDSVERRSKLLDRIIIDGSDEEIQMGEALFQPVVQKIMEDKRHTGNVIWLKDITLERKNTELLEENKKALQCDVELMSELLERAEAATRTKSEFLAKMSHEIRTPMNAIVGMAELCLRESTTPEAKQYAAGIKHASGNLLSIINDILDFSKIESGKLEITRQNYRLSSLINDVISIIRMRVMDESLLFAVNIKSGLPAELIGDEIHIRQILLNLLGNAVKYTKEGSVRLTISGTVTEEHTVMLCIEVSDTGVGIKEEDLAGLFDKFSQFDPVKNRGIEGTGLGLAIAKSLCTAMGGDIEVKSVYREGSVFTVRLPQQFEGDELFAEVEQKNQRVLVYEPRLPYGESISETLEDLGVECSLVSTQSQLYEALQINSYSVLFFSSFFYESVRKLVKEGRLSIKLVALTEYGEAVAFEECRSIAMPVHAISAANALNDVVEENQYFSGEDKVGGFIAPKVRVLVVDDISTNLKVAEGLLAPLKMQIDVCESGKEAVELVSKIPYDLVFMDHMMPGMDGIEATQLIRGLDVAYASTLPIIALTANAVSGAKEMFLSSGFHDFLSKPIEMSRMMEILRRYIPKEKREKIAEQQLKPVTAPFALPDVDVSRGIASLGGGAEQYISILKVFFEDGKNKIEEMEASLNQKKLRDYTTHVHALKSVLASIGADKLSAAAKSLELAGNQENITYIQDTHHSFIKKLRGLLEEIECVVASNRPPESKESFSCVKSGEELLRLKNALQDYNATVISASLEKLQSCLDLNILAEIQKHVSAFEYEEAEQVLEQLLQVKTISDRSETDER